MTTKTDREILEQRIAFELWMSSTGSNVRRVGDDPYWYDHAESAWQVWKAAQAALTACRAALAQPQGEIDRVVECARRLVAHADFKLDGCLSADSKAKDIPSKAVSQVKARHLAALRDALYTADALRDVRRHG
jgi:hypothetical protein